MRKWLIVGCVGLGILGPALCAAAIHRPRSTIDRPLEAGPVFVLGGAEVGGTWSHDALRAGYGAGFLLRPNAAADFLGPFYDWNTALVLRGVYRPVGPGRSLLSADCLLRRYQHDMRRGTGGASFFLGPGLGLTKASHAGGRTKGFSWLLEAGWEQGLGHDLVAVLSAQYRYFDHENQDYGGWSCRAALGIPLPW